MFWSESVADSARRALKKAQHNLEQARIHGGDVEYFKTQLAFAEKNLHSQFHLQDLSKRLPY